MRHPDQHSSKDQHSTQLLMERYIAPNYGRFPIAFSHGQGSYLWDENDRKYLDFGTGIAVCSLGHRHGAITAAVHGQIEQLVHCSNLYQIREQALLARHIVENVMEEPGKVFFCNSGAEANEALIKLARKFGNAVPKAGGEPRTEIITFAGSFHGRTMGGISATAQSKAKEGFAPLLEGFRHVPFNDVEALKDAINPDTVAILLEPIQGEGGIHVATEKFLKTIAKICRKHQILLLFDEVQCGFGRVGHLCGWKTILDSPDLIPDAVSWAKGMGGGIPIGATWTRQRPVSDEHPDLQLCDLLGPGTHGSTFGGGPLVATTSLAVLEEIQQHRLWENAVTQGDALKDAILSWKNPLVTDVRGLGLMLGIVIDETAIKKHPGFVKSNATPAVYLVTKLMNAGLLTVPAGPNVVRLLPALNIGKSEVDEALTILKATFETITA